MKLEVGKVVDCMTQGSLFPVTLWRVVMIVLAFFIVLRLGHILIRIRPIWHT